MSSAITALGQTRINQLRGEENPLVIDRMVLALVPGLDPSQPVDRNQQMPDPAHVVHTYQIPAEFKGYVNPDQVVYSMILGSDVGDFSFNWIGTVEAVTGNVISVTTTPETPKRKTDLASNTTGNNITRNVMMQFQDAQALTGVSISAETWQFDYRADLEALKKKVVEKDDQGNVAIAGNVSIGDTRVSFHEPGDDINLSYVPTNAEMTRRRMLERNGASLLRADYPELFEKISTMYGAIDGDHFSLPDDRGLFERIWDHGAGIDPDTAGRTDRGDGTKGDNVGTGQGAIFEDHRHYITNSLGSGGTNSGMVYGAGAVANLGVLTVGNGNIGQPWFAGSVWGTSGGSETRPINRYKWGGIFY
ncbi:phage tail-collar fiber domain-containing protein [Desulfoluna spongiiphila]|uniref:Phage Tail Collar Domain n=1 Tax=Desulfoluna spongiiphila TaxID=419481 RepID=A0A1G5G3Q9_9BACT|nr:phage tail protein [Desulfoluna spongiiphila]SCY45870.1 Phage Tail Collar Domain [Desulfoluna spongiiphila]